MYKYRPTIKIDLSDFGDNNGETFFIEIKNPHMLPYGDKLEMSKVFENADTFEEKEKAGREFIKGFLVSTNLTDPKDDTPLDISHSDFFEKVPAEIFERITREINPKPDKETKKTDSGGRSNITRPPRR